MIGVGRARVGPAGTPMTASNDWLCVSPAGSDETHVVPEDDLRPHELHGDCWCRPEYDDESDLWSHNSMDGREFFESGERQPS